ncbi:MAG: PEP-CTERM sorting domain-containing protein [Leptolyngbyaceae cyanobacterium RU_5_1]|nr:PEP-CTERM sorting domain-containing protein [Leptolyngbyaceae cyanobacterium RU_5_1]
MFAKSTIYLNKNSINRKILAAIAVTSTLSITLPAQAVSLDIGGLRFSEVSGDFRITGGRVDSSIFVIEQEVTGPNINLFMAIDGLLNACPGVGGCYFRFQSVLTNQTGTPWALFDHELQEIYGAPSPEEDGLSFAQQIPQLRPFTSNRFGAVDEVIDVRDYVNYSGGVVAPGDTVTFNYVIADTTPLNRFFLLQRPNFQAGGGGFINPTPQPTPSPTPENGGIIDPEPSPSPEFPIDGGSNAAVPEPSTILGLLLFGAIAGGVKLKQSR